MSSDVSSMARTNCVLPSSPNWWETLRTRIARSLPAMVSVCPITPLFRQKCLGVELRHVGLAGQQLELDVRLTQGRERRLIEAAGVGEHRHQLVVDAARDVLILLHHLLGDLHSVGLVAAHESYGLEPALEEIAHNLRLARDDLVGREDDMDVEVLDVGEANQNARFALFLEVEGIADVHDGAVDITALERSNLARHGPHWRDVNAGRTPAVPARGLADEPIGE